MPNAVRANPDDAVVVGVSDEDLILTRDDSLWDVERDLTGRLIQRALSVGARAGEGVDQPIGRDAPDSAVIAVSDIDVAGLIHGEAGGHTQGGLSGRASIPNGVWSLWRQRLVACQPAVRDVLTTEDRWRIKRKRQGVEGGHSIWALGGDEQSICPRIVARPVAEAERAADTILGLVKAEAVPIRLALQGPHGEVDQAAVSEQGERAVSVSHHIAGARRRAKPSDDVGRGAKR